MLSDSEGNNLLIESAHPPPPKPIAETLEWTQASSAEQLLRLRYDLQARRSSHEMGCWAAGPFFHRWEIVAAVVIMLATLFTFALGWKIGISSMISVTVLIFVSFMVCYGRYARPRPVRVRESLPVTTEEEFIASFLTFTDWVNSYNNEVRALTPLTGQAGTGDLEREAVERHYAERRAMFAERLQRFETSAATILSARNNAGRIQKARDEVRHKRGLLHDYRKAIGVSQPLPRSLDNRTTIDLAQHVLASSLESQLAREEEELAVAASKVRTSFPRIRVTDDGTFTEDLSEAEIERDLAEDDRLRARV